MKVQKPVISRSELRLTDAGIPCELIEKKTRVTVGPYPTMMPDAVTASLVVLTFVLGKIGSKILDEIGEELWAQIKRLFKNRRKAVSDEEPQAQVEGAIEFDCEGATIKCEFDSFGPIQVEAMHLATGLIRENAELESVLIPREGPIEYVEGGTTKTISFRLLREKLS